NSLTTYIFNSYTTVMQQTAETPLGTIKAYGTLSGYVYLHIPQYLCKQFNVIPSTVFSITYKDGKIVLEQQKEKQHELLG
ncbi:unnamed protein product, partial [marine sediment metagenome]